MKVKEIDRTANVAWSPQHQYPIYLAAGTAAQQLDASFSTNAALEIYALNLADPGHDMALRASVQSEQRFHKISWGTYGQTSGTIVGGCDGGIIQIYNAAKLLKNEPALVSQQTKHQGPVRALDFNSFQNNLLASGASESEIFIWDLNNVKTSMTPGTKSQPPEDVTCIAWNKQVQHILASSFASKCVIWDLRKNDAIIKLSDSTSRVRWNVVAWNPDVATQLCLCSEEDSTPVIQLWDLRFATSPLKVLEGHQRGVLSISWCHQDTDMLLSCSKDNRILCWNPNSNVPGTEVICEINTANQWNFDVSWCPRNPALFVSSSFDGRVSVYSLVGGPQQVQTSNKIADSFPGMENYTQAPMPQTHQAPLELRKAPKWLQRPAGAHFGFGGKLVTFGQQSPNEPGVAAAHAVTISQVVTEPELIQRSSELEAALRSGQFSNYCLNKVNSSQSEHGKSLWQFLAANFEASPKTEFLALLGFEPEELNRKLNNFLRKPANAYHRSDVNQLADRMTTLGRSTDSDSEPDVSDQLLDHATPATQGPEGIEDTGTDAFDVIASQQQQAQQAEDSSPLRIPTGEDADGLISQALLMGNTEAAVELCLQDNRMADAIILAMTGGPDLLARTQYRYFQQNTGHVSTLISAVVTEDWTQVVRRCALSSWGNTLAAAITHASDAERTALCEQLGERLQQSANPDLARFAELCYICCGSYSKLVQSWLARERTVTPDKLQDLVELAMILKKAVELQGKPAEISSRLAGLLREYASVLAAQGSLDTALLYLTTNPGEDAGPAELQELRDRLQCSLRRRSVAPRVAPQVQPRSRTVSANYDQRFNLNPFGSSGGSGMAPPSTMQPAPIQQPPQPAKLYSSPSPGPSLNSGGLASRSKHVLDPSVQSSSSHSQFYPQQTPMQPVQPIQGQHVFMTAPSGGFSQQQQQPYFAPQQTGSNSYGYGGPGAAVYPPGPVAPPTAAFVPAPDPTPPPAMAPPPLLSATQQLPGWNDPPVFNTGRLPPQVEMSAEHAGTRRWREVISHSHSLLEPTKQEVMPQNPITHPLFGAGSPLQGAEPTLSMNGYQSHGYDPYQHQQHQQQFPPPQSFQPIATPQGVEPVSHVTQGPPQPPPAVVKKPIPEEHRQLQHIFDELRTKCAMAANNPQSKRKLDDVARKLEALYDGLRDSRLSMMTVQGLHALSTHIQAGDYPSGLMLHTQLVSGPDFSQIASFMPGIKVLLQTALQLQVYL